jgi:hypothetical protein
MFSGIRKRFTYTNVAVTLALVFAMSGGAYAASRYVITSTKQISPKVLKALAGKAGASGAQGPAGVAGPQGAQGPAGPAGPQGPAGTAGVKGEKGEKGEKGANGTTGFTETLPSGKTEMGVWSATSNATAAEQRVLSSISFTIPLAAAPVPHYIGPEEGEGEAHENLPEADGKKLCTGNVEMPAAEVGSLCVFARETENAEPIIGGKIHFRAPQLAGYQSFNAAGTAGTVVVFQSSGPGTTEVSGSWAVTAE